MLICGNSADLPVCRRYVTAASLDLSPTVRHAVSVTPTYTTTWQRLGHYVRERRLHLRLTQHDVAAAGGPSIATIRNIEAATHDSYRGRTLNQLEDVLGWERGSVDAILNGGEPRLKTEPQPAASAPPPAPPVDTKTLGDLLIERGLRRPDELVLSDHYRIAGDALITRILNAPEFSEAYKDQWLSSYSAMRRSIFEATEAERQRLTTTEPREP